MKATSTDCVKLTDWMKLADCMKVNLADVSFSSDSVGIGPSTVAQSEERRICPHSCTILFATIDDSMYYHRLRNSQMHNPLHQMASYTSTNTSTNTNSNTHKYVWQKHVKTWQSSRPHLDAAIRSGGDAPWHVTVASTSTHHGKVFDGWMRRHDALLNTHAACRFED